MFKFLKKIFYNSNLDFLNEGDIVWCKRYDTEDERVKIDYGHQEGPYIVIHKFLKKVYALACGSNKSLKSLQILKLEYNKHKEYALNKEGYIFVGKLILLNDKRFIKKIDQINEKDLNRIYKSIYLINKRYKDMRVKGFPKRKLKFYYEIGDIIDYNNQTFYINDKNEKYYFLTRVFESKKGNLVINNITYTFNFENNKKIPIQSKIKLLNITDEDMQNNIYNYLIKKRNKLQNNDKFSRGNLISINEDEFYYIYGEYKDNLLVYKIYLDRDRIGKMYKVIIKKGIYYTLFEEMKIPKSTDFKKIRGASILEMEAIKTERKNIKKISKQGKEKNNIIYKEYQPGIIIFDCETFDRYIIIKRKLNTIIYVPLENPTEKLEYTFENRCDFNYEIMEKMDKFKFKTLLNKYYN